MLRVRTASLSDLSAIATLERYGFAPADQWSEASWRAELISLQRVVLTTLDHQGVISVYLAGPTSDLTRLVVARGARRHGLGRLLVTAGMAAAKRAGCAEMLLEVRADNTAARGLYAGAGFTEIACRRRYYHDGTDALILRADLEDGDHGE